MFQFLCLLGHFCADRIVLTSLLNPKNPGGFVTVRGMRPGRAERGNVPGKLAFAYVQFAGDKPLTAKVAKDREVVRFEFPQAGIRNGPVGNWRHGKVQVSDARLATGLGMSSVPDVFSAARLNGLRAPANYLTQS
jgi:hypothetical protein